MSAPTFYAQQMLNLHSRFGLSENAKILLRAHDDWKLRRIDQDELGRIVRLSTNMRKAVTDTITKCASIMRKQPTEVKNCVDIIQACTDILTAADKPPIMSGFPLMKLPAEIRRKVYTQYAEKLVSRAGGVVSFPKKSNCHCSGYTPPTYCQSRRVDMALAQTCSKVKNEFLDFFYQKAPLHFTCSCELRDGLKSNPILRKSLRSVKVHWTGPASDQAFALLAKCLGLKDLEVVISRSTTAYLTPREDEMRLFFTALKPPRLAEARGIDELLTIRGMNNVSVTHLQARQGARRSDEERASLQVMLRTKLKLPRPAGFDIEDQDQ
ncbi:hypothetical protein B0T17DRAFT_591324 [Bombardia bombarda]|uniref:Uncharacterized protein n=1 Tax=Bombardia bombarda TaxID=252184 RepID=A0AA39WTP7_9PEZI|nr:hypothetical protein B0T17DRAFT_591324 [Bombardia bombarda]